MRAEDNRFYGEERSRTAAGVCHPECSGAERRISKGADGVKTDCVFEIPRHRLLGMTKIGGMSDKYRTDL